MSYENKENFFNVISIPNHKEKEESPNCRKLF